MTAQIRVGADLVKPKAIHVFKNGKWQKERMGYVYKSGQWMPIIEYVNWLYKDGVEGIPLHAFFNGGKQDNNVIKESNRIVLERELSSLGSNGPGIITEQSLNVTEYNGLFIEASVEGSSLTRSQFRFGLTETMEENHIFDVYENWRSMDDGMKISGKIDLTDLSGNFYIKAIAIAYNGNAAYRVYIHKLWLE